MRDFSIFEVLQNTLDNIPIQNRVGVALKYDLAKKEARDNLEAIYNRVTQRLSNLSYHLVWARTLETDGSLKPLSIENYKTDYVSSSFHDIQTMKPEASGFLNTSLANWIANHIVRDLSEFLMFYLLGMYETCLIAGYAGSELRPENIVDGRKKSKDFENGGLRQRLKYLKDDFGFEITHHEEVLGLYELRNIFAHFDGVVQQKFCQHNGTLRISWPVNAYKFKRKGRNEWVPYHRVQKPFSSEQYENIQVTWLSRPDVRSYNPGERIKLTHKDLNDLIFFYLYIFNELQRHLVEFIRKQGVRTKDFKKYIVVPNKVSFVTEDNLLDIKE